MKPTFSKEASDLIQRLLDKNSDTRLGSKGAEEIKNHAFFEEINWDQLARREIPPLFKPDLSQDKLKYFNPNLEKAERKPDESTQDDEELKAGKSFDNFTYTTDSWKDKLLVQDQEDSSNN
jgi:serine/threonine protein kinase